MTPLIDVIFLLLLFFMLSSTFSKFAEIELTVGGDAGGGDLPVARTAFLRIAEGGLTLNGRPVALADMPGTLAAGADETALILSVTGSASAQGLADVLVALRGLPGLQLSVIGPE